MIICFDFSVHTMAMITKNVFLLNKRIPESILKMVVNGVPGPGSFLW